MQCKAVGLRGDPTIGDPTIDPTIGEMMKEMMRKTNSLLLQHAHFPLVLWLLSSVL